MGKQRMVCAGVITPKGGWICEERHGRAVYRRIGRRRTPLDRAITFVKWFVVAGFGLTACLQLGQLLGRAVGQ